MMRSRQRESEGGKRSKKRKQTGTPYTQTIVPRHNYK